MQLPPVLLLISSIDRSEEINKKEIKDKMQRVMLL